MKLKYLLAPLLLFPGMLLAQSELTSEEIEELLGVKIRFATHMAFNPSIVRAVEIQNTQAIPLEEIKLRDESWKNAGDQSNALIRQTTQNRIARYFQLGAGRAGKPGERWLVTVHRNSRGNRRLPCQQRRRKSLL